MTTKYFGLPAMAAALMLTACGGGGGDGGSGNAAVGNTPPGTPTTPVTPPVQPTITASAEGVYEGTITGGLSHFSLVTDTSRLFSIVGTVSGGVFGVTRVLEGIGTSDNGTFTARDVREYGLNASPDNGSFAGTYVPGASLNGVLTMSSSAATTTFTGTALTSATYVYNTPAKVADIAGAWTLKDLNGANVALVVTADGSFTGTSAGTCAITGSMTPASSSKNYFTFKVVSGTAPCPRPGDVTTGVAVAFTIGATRQLMAAGSGVTRVNGTGWVGAR
jgi:hypothetical protein